jgi:hypothetical protein
MLNIVTMKLAVKNSWHPFSFITSIFVFITKRNLSYWYITKEHVICQNRIYFLFNLFSYVINIVQKHNSMTFNGKLFNFKMQFKYIPMIFTKQSIFQIHFNNNQLCMHVTPWGKIIEHSDYNISTYLRS